MDYDDRSAAVAAVDPIVEVEVAIPVLEAVVAERNSQDVDSSLLHLSPSLDPVLILRLVEDAIRVMDVENCSSFALLRSQ